MPTDRSIVTREVLLERLWKSPRRTARRDTGRDGVGERRRLVGDTPLLDEEAHQSRAPALNLDAEFH
jgi:hypothetical protein